MPKKKRRHLRNTARYRRARDKRALRTEPSLVTVRWVDPDELRELLADPEARKKWH